jgi:hypothetical protein
MVISNVEKVYRTGYLAEVTNFKATWISLTCDVENNFTVRYNLD